MNKEKYRQEVLHFFTEILEKARSSLERIELLVWKKLVVHLPKKTYLFHPFFTYGLGVGVFFLLIGVAFSFTSHQVGLANMAEQKTQKSEVLSSRLFNTVQRNILLIFVDRLDSEYQQIEGVWLLVNASSTNRWKMLPIKMVPEKVEESNTPPGMRLFDRGGILSPEFIEQLHARSLMWDVYVVVDRAGLAGINRLMGDSLPEFPSPFDLEAEWEGLQSAGAVTKLVQSQALYLKKICEESDQILQKFDSDTILSLLNGHIQSDRDFSQLSRDWQNLKNQGYANHCEFPTLGSGLVSQTNP